MKKRHYAWGKQCNDLIIRGTVTILAAQNQLRRTLLSTQDALRNLVMRQRVKLWMLPVKW